MRYKEFMAGVEQLGQRPAPQVWSRIEHSLQTTPLLVFPRWRMTLLAATFMFLFLLPTSMAVANQQRQEVYAFLQHTGSTEYVALASTNYY